MPKYSTLVSSSFKQSLRETYGRLFLPKVTKFNQEFNQATSKSHRRIPYIQLKLWLKTTQNSPDKAATFSTYCSTDYMRTGEDLKRRTEDSFFQACGADISISTNRRALDTRHSVLKVKFSFQEFRFLLHRHTSYIRYFRELAVERSRLVHRTEVCIDPASLDRQLRPPTGNESSGLRQPALQKYISFSSNVWNSCNGQVSPKYFVYCKGLADQGTLTHSTNIT